MRGEVGAATRVIALLGDPVRHSLSPAMQNRAFSDAGLDAVYVALRCDTADVAGLMRGLARAGGGGNVTLPHKEVAAAALDRPSEAVRSTGACNTFWLEDGKLHGDNTDVEGLRRALLELMGGGIGGARVLLLGAGGAARAALHVLVRDGAREVVIWNRTPERATGLSRRLGERRTRVVESREELHGEGFDLLLNATRLGLDQGDPLPFDPAGGCEVEAVFDLVYRVDETDLVRRSRELGIPARDGREMLVQQGAAAFERWWGRWPRVEVMRDALEAAGDGREG